MTTKKKRNEEEEELMIGVGWEAELQIKQTQAEKAEKKEQCRKRKSEQHDAIKAE